VFQALEQARQGDADSAERAVDALGDHREPPAVGEQRARLALDLPRGGDEGLLGSGT
jgi:hypothetical protein